MGLHERFDELAYLLTMTVGVFQLIVHPRASSLDPVPGGLLRAPVAARNQRDGSRNGERVTIPDREGGAPAARTGLVLTAPPPHVRRKRLSWVKSLTSKRTEGHLPVLQLIYDGQ